MRRVRVHKASMPLTVRGFTVRDDFEYLILINKDISQELQENAYKHEWQHILNNDFENGMKIGKLEAMRHAV